MSSSYHILLLSSPWLGNNEVGAERSSVTPVDRGREIE